MQRRFRITNTSDGSNLGSTCEYRTSIKTQNSCKLFNRSLRTVMFDGLRIRLIDGDFLVEGILS